MVAKNQRLWHGNIDHKNIDEIAKTFNIPVLARIPMQEETSRAVDAGDIESLDIPELKEAAETVEKLLK